MRCIAGEWRELLLRAGQLVDVCRQQTVRGESGHGAQCARFGGDSFIPVAFVRGRAVCLVEGGASRSTVMVKPEEITGAGELKLDKGRGDRAGGGFGSTKESRGSHVVCAPFSSQLTRNCRRHC